MSNPEFNDILEAAAQGKAIEILKSGVWEQTPGVIFGVPRCKYRVRPEAEEVRVVYGRGTGFSAVARGGCNPTSPRLMRHYQARVDSGEARWVTDWIRTNVFPQVSF
jgi:hypothetical protein